LVSGMPAIVPLESSMPVIVHPRILTAPVPRRGRALTSIQSQRIDIG
jgi:hypothetical protein